MDKLSSLQQAYDALLRAGRVSNKKEFAALLGREYTGIINAFNGNEKFLTQSLVAKAVAAANGVQETDGVPMRVPMIPVEAHAGSLTEFADAVNEYDCEMVVSPVRGAAFAIQVTGNSMAPAYPSGARILCVLRVASRCFSSAALAFYEQQSNNNCKKKRPAASGWPPSTQRNVKSHPAAKVIIFTHSARLWFSLCRSFSLFLRSKYLCQHLASVASEVPHNSSHSMVAHISSSIGEKLQGLPKRSAMISASVISRPPMPV